MESLRDVLNSLIPILGQTAVDALAEELKTVLAGMDKGWKKTVLSLLTSAVEKYGPEGIKIALEAINDLMDGKSPDIDWADLRTASDVVARLQNIEADEKSAVKDWLIKVSDILAKIIQGIIKGLTSENPMEVGQYELPLCTPVSSDESD